MKGGEWLVKAVGSIGLMLALGISANANAGWFGIGGTSWKEEVLLHDGSKIIVERLQSYGGRYEIGQSSPVKEHTISFSLQNSGKTLSWTSEYGEDLGRTNFNLLALHILSGVPYLVVEPNLCLSYNKWGRPNPPYVFFKHDGKAWQRILLTEFPTEFKAINLIVNNGREKDIEKLASKLGHVSAEDVRKINSSLTQPEYKTILREPIANAEAGCGEMVRTNDGGWIGIGWFRDQPSREACLKYCERKKIGAQQCPCETLFKGR